MWNLRDLVKHSNQNQAQINDKWVPARPVSGTRTVMARIREALAVFTGKADCFMWPEGQ